MSGLKQRIIGALVLISLAVIFVPMMFDEPHDERAVRSLDIPEEPPFPEVDVSGQDESMSGVPDYRVEEVEPAPTPEVVEDPPMGTRPAVGPEGQDNAATGEVPLVGESEPVESAPDVADEQASSGAAPEAQEPGSEQETSSAPNTNVTPADPDPTGEGDFERTLEGAWVLQLGSFGNEDNARRLRDSVRERGYGAHLQEVERDGQKLVRVFSGPFAEKTEAEKAKEVLDKAFNIKALVTKGEG
ncbi:SPOR domain-containing protein [Marinobacter lacisalsi]|uniref:SPOR domain-containing protein n=1 Tax=Marinobacter lacisalsi TaxID=475979 RepID=A0ABV8QKD0_9GAMM